MKPPIPSPSPRLRAAENEWLPLDPPPVVLTLVGWLILVVFAAVVVASILIRFPETIHCRFRLVPESGADPIQSPVNGVLHGILADEGKEVGKGELLFEIRSDELLNWQTELRSDVEESRALEERVRRSEETHQSLLSIKGAELKQFEQERGFRRQYRDSTQDLLRRSRELREKGLISEVELLRAELDLANAEKDLNITEHGLQKVLLERMQIESERSRQQSDERAASEKLKNVMASLKSRLADFEGGVLKVRAPYDAIVVSVTQHNPGSVVRGGQELCQLARTGDRPLVEIQLPQTGLDRVVPGQEARLFFDAFPYQRYGTIPVQIGWVSPSAVVRGDTQQFAARAPLLRVDFEKSGRRIPVRVGMVGEARIRVGESTVMESVFEPLTALREQSR